MEDSDFLISKQNYKVTLMKTVCLAKRKTHGMTEQNWESRNISTHRVKWFLTKKLRNFTEERIVRIVFSTSVTGQIRCPYTKKRKKERKRTLTHILYYKQKWIKSRSKQITDLKVKSKTIKVLTENTQKKSLYLWFSQNFLDRVQKHKSQKEKKW